MNLIIIMLDSLRYDHVGCYGNDWINTPSINRFAEESVVFENAYPEGIPTMPVRTSLFTGNKALNNRYWQPLAPEDVSMAKIMDEHGYLNMMITDCYHMFKPNMNFHRGFHGFEWIRGQEFDGLRTDTHNMDLQRYIKDAHHGTRQIRGDNLYNELIKIPMMIRFPKGEYAGKRIKALVEIPDILPTILDFLNHPLDADYMNGKSMLPLITGEADRIHPYVTIGFFGSEDRCIRDETWSFIRRSGDRKSELYNQIEDPAEENNLIDNHPEKAKEMDAAISIVLNNRLQKEHWLQIQYDVPGLCEGRHPPYARWKK